MFSAVFVDKRLTAAILVIWIVIVLVVFACLGVLNSDFFHFGPSPHLHFMALPIDTFNKWLFLAVYCCVDTLVKSMGHDSVTLWLSNTIADPRCKTLPYRQPVCLLVMEIYFAYVHISGMFKFFLSLAQVDFVLISGLSDMTMKIFSYSAYMKDKQVIDTVEEFQDEQALIGNSVEKV